MTGLRGHVERWMRRRSREHRPPIILRYRRVYILPTRNGWLFAVLLLAMWLGAINYSNSMMFILVFLLVGLSIVSILHTFQNLVNIRVDVARTEPVFAGEPAVFPIRVDAPGKSTRQAIGLRRRGQSQAFADVSPGTQAELPLGMDTEHRGILKLERFDVFTTYPLGLFIAWSPVWMSAGCLVYPRPETGPVPPPSGGSGAGKGRRQTTGADDFAGLRRYRAGDPVRHIAWKSGHARELQTKQFAAESADRLYLDFHETGLHGIEARLSRLCRWVLDAEREDRVFGLCLPGNDIPPARGPAHTRRCLEALALFGS